MHCLIGMGGNLGDTAAVFSDALQRLRDASIPVLRVSGLYRTAPVGVESGAAFLNAAALVDSPFSPGELLSKLHAIEDSAGRQRTTRWGARTLDLDLLLCADLVIDEPHLCVPHPGVVYRRFVLDPLAEIAADWVHPICGRTIAELRARLLRRPLPVILQGGSALQRQSLRDRLLRRFRELAVTTGCRDESGRSEIEPPAGPETHGDPTVIDLNTGLPGGSASERSSASAAECTGRPGGPFDGRIRIRPDPQLAADDLSAAVEALVTAMLDEPQRLDGTVRGPGAGDQ